MPMRVKVANGTAWYRVEWVDRELAERKGCPEANARLYCESLDGMVNCDGWVYGLLVQRTGRLVKVPRSGGEHGVRSRFYTQVDDWFNDLDVYLVR